MSVDLELLLAGRQLMDLPCTCTPDTHPGGYALGCQRHMAVELSRGPSTRETYSVTTVTYYRGSAKIHTPVYRDGQVWSQEETVECEHLHTELETAMRCSRRLARQHGTPR